MMFLPPRRRDIEETEMTPRPETVALAAGRDLAQRRALRFGGGAGRLAARLWRREASGFEAVALGAASADTGDDPTLWRRARDPENDRADAVRGDRRSEPASAWFARVWPGRRR